MPKRYLLVVATFLLSLLLYIDRTCISTAKGPIVADLGLTDTQFGWILSAFAFGYALLQAPSGAMADKMGSRLVLATVVTAWSIFTGLTAAAWNFVSMFVVRFLFGAGEAGAFPGMAKAVYSWIPTKERGLVKGINFSASRLGAAATMPILPLVISGIGWKLTFVVLMLVGFVWAGIWWFWFRDEPENHPSISEEELKLIKADKPTPSANTDDEDAGAGISYFKNKNMWLMMGQYFGSNFTFFFCLSWLFTYVKNTYDLSFESAGFYAAIPLLGGAAGNVFSGWMVDKLYAAGHKDWSRRLPAIIGFTLASAGILLSLGQADVVGAVAWLTIAVFGADMTLSPSWSFCIDIGGKHAGKISGTMNMAGNLGSAIVALAFPYLLAWTGGPEAFFYMAAALNAVAILFWILSNPKNVISA
ncbi:MFS transporter [Pelagicoccus mobilis]|uniref:MFS transporter n=1 Tax=Pelagicoccus mobilis TaxID=415221 RepID=A0A934S1Q6_9BACT|nr:MFS transporter [Pelagicoccus mobilis]MBK1880303.1 MFS transporter [Pelagicoccus mobilis]